MLLDKDKFGTMENLLRENGTLEKYGKMHGEIIGRMMITLTEIPEELDIQIEDGRSVYAFACSFDFYDTSLGIALYTDTLTVASPLWCTPQSAEAETPNEEWTEFFIITLAENIDERGKLGIPMYTFLYNVGDFTVTPYFA